MSMSIQHPLLLVSPHLDDAVFSCGNLIAACPGSVVVTLFAGVPRHGTPAPQWDRRAGFASAREAVEARREEDRAALSLLNAEPVWLDFLDHQYGNSPTAGQVAARLETLLANYRSCAVVVPCGLYHSDHLLAHRACASLWAQYAEDGPPWLFYEDAFYRRSSGALHALLLRWHMLGLKATPVDLAISEQMPRKARACNAYGSQISLFDSATLGDLSAPERYWRWEKTPSGAAPRRAGLSAETPAGLV
ncbi:PIG-L deacetylase family protein [Cupriavidus malaysiensis]|nr:PIG-L family deacetylase [Cupriavidus malaysiensis]